MGTWNSKPFGNDTALDWLADLEAQKDLAAFLAETLDKVLGGWDGDSTEAEEAVAAAAFVAASAVEPVGSTTQEAKKLIALRGFVPSEQLLAMSLQAVERICTNSELRELWEESDGLRSWLSQMDKLRDSLVRASVTGLPSRVPKKPGMPRSLYRLVELYSAEPSEKIREKIRGKLRIIDVNKSSADTDWKSPLSLICRYGLLDEARDLLQRGADPNNSKPNPFVEACVGGHVEVAELLRQHGATIFFKVERQVIEGAGNPFDDIMLRQYRVRGIEPKPMGYEYCLALFAVAREGGAKGIEYLVSIGADLNQTDLNDENLIHKASQSGNVEMLRLLIAAGLDPGKTKGKFAESPLHYAVSSGKCEAVAVLLENGANPNHIDKFEGSEHRWYQTSLDICEDDGIRQLLRRFGAMGATEIMNSSTA